MEQVLVSDIISEGLEKLGPNGEHWCKNALRIGSEGNYSYCAVGSITYAKGATIRADSYMLNLRGVEALNLLQSYSNNDIVNLNNRSPTFAPVKAVMCNALKAALEAEAQQEIKANK